MSRSALSAFLLAFALAVAQLPARGDVLTLKNGDRLSGTVLGKDGTSVKIRTSYAGEISVRWSDVEGIATEQPVHIILSDESSLKGMLLQAGRGRVRVKAGEIIETAPFDLAKLSFINPPPEVSGQGVKVIGHVSVGVTVARGNTRNQDARLEGEWIARARDNRITVGAAFNQSEDNGRDTASNGRGSLKYDHFLSKRWYMYVNGSAERDRFKDLDLRTSLGGGMGYQFHEGEGLSLSAEGGLTYVNDDHRVAVDEGYASARWALRYGQALWRGRLHAFHDQELLVSLDDADDMFLRTQTGLRFPLTQQLVGSIQLNLDWDRTPSPGKSSTDRTVLFTMGYRW